MRGMSRDGAVDELTVVLRPERLAGARAWSRTLALPLFATTIFVGACLLFLVEPMAAKMVLPLFGGSPSVWTTAMVFFQGVLLAGYLYAHLTTRLLSTRRQPLAHALVLLASLAALPIGRHLTAPGDSSPSLWLIGVLALSVGAPFFLLATASPVLQRWFAETGHPAGKDPYFLYAASNAGSLLALLAYPVAVEPRLPISGQTSLWSAGYVAFVCLSLACLVVLRAQGARAAVTPRAMPDGAAPALTWRTRLRWVSLAFVPSSLMLGATSYLSTDIAPVPLLWVIPLAVYLLTFVVAFARRPIVRPGTAGWVLAVLASALVMSLFSVFPLPIWALVLLHVSTLFFGGVVAHGRLAADRPAPKRLTDFYVMLSVGGVLGGVFNALLAPRLFDSLFEYPLALVLVLLLRPAKRPGSAVSRFGWPVDFVLPLLFFVVVLGALALVPSSASAKVIVGVAAAAVLVFAHRPRCFALGIAALLTIFAFAQSSGSIYSDRTFFGVLRVTENASGQRLLVHGRTSHGVQSLDPSRAREPLAYYARTGPIGDVFARLQQPPGFRRIDVVGLGVGSLAAYGRPGQLITFYEIDPGVVRIATDPRLFTFLSNSEATVRVVVGDGRIALEMEPAGRSDLLVIDAFSSDAIPVHLLTREAVVLYLEKLRPDGILAFNVSNRYLDLSPVLAGIARELGLFAVERFDHSVPSRDRELGTSASRWVVLARDLRRLEPLATAGWRPVRATAEDGVWRDDFSNILGAIDWSG